MVFCSRTVLYLFFTALVCCQNVVAQSTHTPLRKGDWAYDRARYKEAEQQYRIAADRDMGNPQAVYNLGNTLYQQGNWEIAEQRYKQVASKNLPPEQQADALHNLGDTYLKQRKYKEAVQAYEGSLRLRPGDSGTKQNLQMAKKRLREEQNKAQQNQQQQNQAPNDGQQEQNPQDQQQPPPDQSGQPKQDNQGQPQQPQNQPNQKEQEQRMKKEDAKRLLETAVGPDDRKNAQKYRSNQPASKPKDGKKDW